MTQVVGQQPDWPVGQLSVVSDEGGENGGPGPVVAPMQFSGFQIVTKSVNNRRVGFPVVPVGMLKTTKSLCNITLRGSGS